MADPTVRPRQAIREEHQADLGKALGDVISGIGLFLLGLSALILMLWLVFASVKATSFDADGVRCYRAATELSCLKTAEPPR